MTVEPELESDFRFGSRRFSELLKRERHDMAWLVHCVAAMYDEISGGRVSIPMTYPSEVVGQFNERVSESWDEGYAEARKELAQQIDDIRYDGARDPSDYWRGFNDALDRIAAILEEATK